MQPERARSTPPGRGSVRTGRAPVDALVWAALLLAPALYVVELTGPRWLNLALRGTWVLIVATIVGILAIRWCSGVRGRR